MLGFGLLHHVGERSAGAFWLRRDAGKHFLRQLTEESRGLLKDNLTIGVVLDFAAQDAGIAHYIPGKFVRRCEGAVFRIHWCAFHWRT